MARKACVNHVWVYKYGHEMSNEFFPVASFINGN